MDTGLLLGFWAVAALLVFVPGADWAFAISAGIGRRPIVPAIAGVLAGYVVVIVAIAVGLGAVVAAEPVLLTALTLVGAGYLVWLGVSTLVRRPAAIGLDTGAAPVARGDSSWGDFLRGAGTSGFNPKGLLLLLALLPQFTSPSASLALPLQMLALGGVHLLDCAIVYTGVALAARRVLASRPTASAVVTRASGGVMALVGLALLAEQGVALG